jgi:flagellar motor switch protein FliM
MGSSSRIDESAIRLYDFRRPHRVSKERLRTIEAIYERLAKSLESWVIGRIRGQIEMQLRSVEQLSFGEFTQSLSTPCASFLLDVSDSGGFQAIVDVGQDFALHLVDRLFGGYGAQTHVARPLSRVERMAVRSMIDRTAVLLRESWADHISLNFEVSSFESFPDILLQNANRDDPVLVANIGVTAGEMSSRLLICMPFAVLDRFFTNTGKRRVNAATGSEQERSMTRAIAEQSLRITRVSVAARLPEFRLSMRELAKLTEGGIIATGLSADSPVHVLIGKQERFIGTAGRVAQQYAVRIQGPIQEFGEAASSGHNASVKFSPSVVPDFEKSDSLA